MKALVVDDNDLVRSNVAEALRQEGWSVREADSAEHAFRLLHEDSWSLVFCDVKLSDKSNQEGYAVLRRFNEEQPEAQIVLMTGHGSAVGALDAVSQGAYDYLMKPFDVADVLRISESARRGMEKRARKTVTGELQSELAYTSDIALVVASSAFVEVMKLVGRVATTSLPVLIRASPALAKRSSHAPYTTGASAPTILSSPSTAERFLPS